MNIPLGTVWLLKVVFLFEVFAFPQILENDHLVTLGQKFVNNCTSKSRTKVFPSNAVQTLLAEVLGGGVVAATPLCAQFIAERTTTGKWDFSPPHGKKIKNRGNKN